MYIRPVLGENADGCQSFAPGAVGQMSRTTFPNFGAFSGTYCSSPLFRSTPRVRVHIAEWIGRRTSPVRRSITYM